ncbi:MAG: sensor histidine kinase [Janthinobacterium lividum]
MPDLTVPVAAISNAPVSTSAAQSHCTAAPVLAQSLVPATEGQYPAEALEREVTRRTAALRSLLGRREALHEEEKSALARDLHADLGASLTALNMHLAIMFKQMPDEARLHDRAAAIKALTSNIAQSTRRLQASLRPDKLDSFGLKVAIADLATEFANYSGLECQASMPDEELSYSPEVSMALFRLVQEALNNVSRHAKASKVDIVLDDNEDEIMLSVRDNGIGIAAEKIDMVMRHGLLALRERALYLGGSLRIMSPAGGNAAGTGIVMHLDKNRLAEMADEGTSSPSEISRSDSA